MAHPEDFDPFAPETIEDPYPFYRALRDEAPVYRIPGADYYAVSRYEDIRAVVMDPARFSSNIVAIILSSGEATQLLERPDVSGGPVDVLAIQDPPLHGPQRKLVTSVLNRESVAAMEPEIRAFAISLIDALLASETSDAMAGLAFRLPMTVAADLVGFPRADVPNMKRWSDESIALLSGVNTPEEMAVHMAESWAFYEYIRATFGALADAPPSPLLAALVAGSRGPGAPLSEDEAHSIILQLLIAGSDSSASMMGSALWILARDPGLQATLRADPAKIPAFLEEVLRLESPFQGHFRVAREDGELAGTKLRAGDRLMALWASGNRDEREYENPDRVRLDRRNATKHFGFGHGLHLCVGAPLARLEGRVVLEEILRRTRGFEPTTDTVRHRPSAFVRTLEALPIRWTPR